MRVSSLMMTGNYLQQLNSAYEKQAKLMEQTDGSSIHRPSDNPVNYTKNMIYNTSLSHNEQYTANVKSAVSWMKSTDSAMINMTDALKTVVEKTVAAANDKAANDTVATGTEVKKLVEEIVAQGNSQLGGRYLFSGQNDTTEPFVLSTDLKTRGLAKTLDDSQSSFFNDTAKVGELSQMLSLTGTDGNSYYINTMNGNIYTSEFVATGYKDAQNASGHGSTVKTGDEYTTMGSSLLMSDYFTDTGELTPTGTNGITIGTQTYKFSTVQQQIVTYRGDNNKISMVKQNGPVNTAIDSVNVTGEDVFGSRDIFGGSTGTVVLNDMLTVAAQMSANNSKWLSSDGITLANNASNMVINAETTLAGRNTVYNDAITTLESQNTVITQDITNVSATDVSKLAVQLMTAQTLYNMSLSVGSKILPQSLADYLS